MKSRILTVFPKIMTILTALVISNSLSSFVPKYKLNWQMQMASFNEFRRQRWDHENVHTSPPLVTMVSVLPQYVERIRCWHAEHCLSVCQKTVRNLSAKYNPGTWPLNLYEVEYDRNISLKDLNSFDSAV